MEVELATKVVLPTVVSYIGGLKRNYMHAYLIVKPIWGQES
jgi:hypothetical protein